MGPGYVQQLLEKIGGGGCCSGNGEEVESRTDWGVPSTNGRATRESRGNAGVSPTNSRSEEAGKIIKQGGKPGEQRLSSFLIC